MDILLINPAYVKPESFSERFGENRALIKKGNMYVFPFEPPIGLASIVSSLRQKGIDARLLDVQGKKMDLNQVRLYLMENPATFVGISAMTTTYPFAIELARLVREVLPNSKIIMGGVHPTVLPDEVMKEEYVDYVFRGEGDVSLPEFILRNTPDSIPGICFKENGKTVISDKAPLVKNVDSLPMPDYGTFPVDEYVKHNELLRSLKGISMIISRGCPYDCSFCSVKETMGRGYRIRSPRLVVEEMNHLKESYGIEGIWFKDSIFNLKRSWVEEFCNELIKSGLGMKWQMNTRVDLIDEKQVAMMANAGLAQIDFGIESGSPETLKTLKKSVDISQIEFAVALAKRYVDVSGFFMIGVPGETEKDIDMTFDLARRLELDRASWSVFTPLPGSHLYNELKKAGRLPEDIDWRKIHFINTDVSYSEVNHERLIERFWEIQNYFSEELSC